MNASINWNRLFLIFNKYFFENKKSFGLLLLAVAAFLTLWLGVNVSFSNPNMMREEFQLIYYFTGLFLSGCLSAGVHFSSLGSKPKAIHYLLTPASSLEKFMCAILFAVVIFLIGYTVVFYAVDSIMVMIANYKFNTQWKIINLFLMNQYENRFFDGPYSAVFNFYFPAQAFFLLVSIYFSKNGLFKGIIGTGLIWVFSIFILMTLMSSFPPGSFHSGMGEYEINDISGINKTVAIPTIITVSIIVFYKFLLTPLLWAATYFRLKEKELK